MISSVNTSSTSTLQFYFTYHCKRQQPPLILQGMLASICLHILHLIFYLTSSLANLWRQLDRRKPCPLKAARAKTPSHLALLLVGGRNGTHDVPDAVIDENVAQTISWCQDIGIGKLTIYANKGKYSTVPLLRYIFPHPNTLKSCRDFTWLSSTNSNTIPTRFV